MRGARHTPLKVGDRHGDLEIIEIFPNKLKEIIKLRVKCSVCAKDSEMFGDGSFITTSQGWRRGNVPCACSGIYRWSPEQYRLRVERSCREKDITLVSFQGDAAKNIVVDLKCNKDGYEWKVVNIGNFLKGSCCPKCKIADLIKSLSYSDEERNTDFKEKLGKDNTPHYWRNESRSNYWNYICPICSNDIYFEEGLCSGIFGNSGGNILKNAKSCRCSPNFKWSQKQREFLIRKTLEDENSPHNFMGWVGRFKGTASVFKLSCSIHGIKEKSLASFLHGATKCTLCSKGGFDASQPASIYTIKASSTDSEFSGYGITNSFKTRLPTHIRNLTKAGFSIEDLKCFNTSGEIARRIENEIIGNFEVYSQDIAGFKRESTLYQNYNGVVDFILSRLPKQILKTTSKECNVTYDNYIGLQEDILDSYRAGELTEAQVEREMGQLQSEWEEYGED